MATIKEYLRTYLWRDMMLKIVTVNMVVWIIVAVGTLLCQLLHVSAHEWIGLFTLPANIQQLPARFWTVFTYMFVQTDFLHLVVNMMWLMLFGRLFMMMQGPDRLLALYIYGGLAGAVGFIAFTAIHGMTYGSVYGASAAVLAVCGAIAVLVPKMQVDLIFIGPVKIIWICAVCVLFFVVLTESMVQTVVHGMGFAMGIVYALLRKHGIDITRPAIALVSMVAARIKGVPVAKLPTNRRTSDGKATAAEHRELDSLLQKVSRSGYSSLSASERQRLFDLSQKIKI